ncbi:hypothetical protein [Actinomadura sp. HBU206391]|uniref:hypothetical protein n=1 Tax=Actinomadura sp. HBU206391 TaxID=2731692 RepID=UPI00164F8ED4|nr:hypothetical protein [Actinomadura sp. HBU206391]MBC6462269.1 hypothetical protein [Actinomadura sp. HBU206391]
METAQSNVHVTYHQLYVADADTLPDPKYLLVFDNGLVAIQPGIAVVSTGIHTGNVAVTVQIWDQAAPAPTSAHQEEWDEIAEVTLEAHDAGEVGVVGLMSDLPGLPELTPGGPGRYRLRIYARGRDTLVDGVATEPVEDYLIMTWPTQLDDQEIIYRQTDDYGATLRASAQHARATRRWGGEQ